MIAEWLAKLADTIGIIGVIFLLISYFLLNTNKISSQSLRYQLFNFFGAALILFSLFYAWNTAAVLIEICWIIISLIGIYRIVTGKRQHE